MTDGTILVVDDDPGIRETLTALLEDEGYTVSSAKSGSEAMGLLEAGSFSLIISDVRMPDGDGVELLKQVRERHPELPMFIMMSGFTDVSATEARELGANAFFHKPFDVEALLDEVEEEVSRAAG